MNFTLEFRTSTFTELVMGGRFASRNRQTAWLEKMRQGVGPRNDGRPWGYIKELTEAPFRLPCCSAFQSLCELREHRRESPNHAPSPYFMYPRRLPDHSGTIRIAQEAVNEFFGINTDCRFAPSPEPPNIYTTVSLVSDIVLPFGDRTVSNGWQLSVAGTADGSVMRAHWDNHREFKAVIERFVDKIPSFVILNRAGAKILKALRLMNEHHNYQGTERMLKEALGDVARSLDL